MQVTDIHCGQDQLCDCRFFDQETLNGRAIFVRFVLGHHPEFVAL